MSTSAAGPRPNQAPAEIHDMVLQLAGRLRAAFETAAAELNLPPVQAGVLLRMEGPSPMREIASMLACDPSYVTGIVDGLEERGLATRRPAPADRRVKQLVFTEEGERYRRLLRERAGALTAAILDLPAADRETLHALLTRLLANPAPPGAPPGSC
ncbi:MarR family transcriptional regulator [Actinomadura craniellae]|uniref:MarR family transcriptional regulator n=1 Tax=Actinomadura craniellae TaxID=2231787 RepID=A0A365H1Y1_9ACTN|nr:MarR family winged helix-turn-helix transcriptional regulator [Actinomadura craniellae]RAY13036.1 MarR family transcriptional regulator [Actinomadura craniellae]